MIISSPAVLLLIIICFNSSASFSFRTTKLSLLRISRFTSSTRIYSSNDDSKLFPESVKVHSNIFKMNFQPDIIAILTIYFVQGALGLSRLAISFFLKDELHLSPAEVAAFAGISTIPWVIKPLYGFLSDGLPLFGYKRRSYLIASGLVGCLSWLTLGLWTSDASGALLANVIASLSVAVSDVVADSIVVEKSRDNSETSGNLQSLCWGAAAVGGIISAYFSGYLLQHLTPREVFSITSLFPLAVSLMSAFIEETRIIGDTNISAFQDMVVSKSKDLVATISNPAIYLPVLFVFLWRATPAPDSALFFFSVNNLGFQAEFLGRISLVSAVASLAGIVVYQVWLKDLSVKTIIYWTTLISVPLSLTQVLLTTHLNRIVGIPDQAFALTDSVVLTVLGQIAFMPTLVLAAALCPPGVEGTLFAALMSIYNAAGSVGSEAGALLTSLLGVTDTNFDNLSLLVVMCSLSSLLPLLFIDYLNPPLPNQSASDAESNANMVLLGQTETEFVRSLESDLKL